MSDSAATVAQPPTEFPSPTTDVVFADGVWSLTSSPAVVKYYLARFDPSFAGDGRVQVNAVVQVVMPIDGFVNMFAFFEAQLRDLINRGFVSEERLEQARAVLRQVKT